MQKAALGVLGLFITFVVWSQQVQKTENVIIITLDGMRWQEVFGGIDSVLMTDTKYTSNSKELKAKYINAKQ